MRGHDHIGAAASVARTETEHLAVGVLQPASGQGRPGAVEPPLRAGCDLGRTQFAAVRLERRAAWVEVLEWAAAFADAVAAGGQPSLEDRRELAGAARKAGAFPLPYVSAASAAAAFRDLVQGFVAVEVVELRLALAKALAETARCCRRMIEIDDADQAAALARRHPEA